MSYGEFCPKCRKYYGDADWHCKCHLPQPPKEPQPSQGAGAEEEAAKYAERHVGGPSFNEFEPGEYTCTAMKCGFVAKSFAEIDEHLEQDHGEASRLQRAYLAGHAAGRASQDARIGELQKELHWLQDDLCEKVRSEGGRLEARAEAAEKRVAELGAQLAETQVNLVRKNAELIEARERLAEAHKELATMLRERGCLSESVERLVNERDALRASLALARGSLEKIANHCGITWCLVCDDNPKHCELGEVRAVISQLPGVEKDGERGEDGK